MSFAPLTGFLPFPQPTLQTPPPAKAVTGDRRRFLASAASLAGLTLLASPPATGSLLATEREPQSERMAFTKSPPDKDLRQVTLKIEAAGELKLNADGQKVTRRPVQVAAELTYDELLAPNGKAVRSYSQAQAKLQIGNTSFPTRLDDDHHVIAVHREGEQAVLYSPLGPLTRDELELLQSPGNGPSLSDLLPEQEVAIGDSWSIPDTVLARLLWLDAVSSSEVKATWKSLDESTALVTLQGPVSGAVGGIATDIDLQGKLNYDVAQKLVTWVALGIKENRSIGHAEPGFETTTQVKIAIRRLDASTALSAETLARLPLDYLPGNGLLQYESTEGRFRALLDRRWRLMVDRHDLTVLRLIDRGDLIAQCNLSRLPALAPGKQFPLEELQDDIKQSLGKNFRQFVEASQSQTDDGLRILRVAVVGEASELAVQWNYYHVSNDKGQRLALVFTFESNLLDRFADVDRPLAASLQFLSDPEPTTAPTKEKSASQETKPSATAPKSTSLKKSPPKATKR